MRLTLPLNLSETEITAALRDGHTLYYRATATETKEDAREMQDRLLAAYEYPWNVQGQRR